MNLFPIAKNGADVAALAAVLDRLAVGDIATYAELTEAVGRDIQKHRYLLDTALQRLLRKRKVFGCIKETGYQRLSDSEIVNYSFSAFKRIRRIARKNAVRLSAVEFERLSNEERVRHNLHISALGAIAHAATPSNLAKLNQACSNSQSMQGLPTAHVLKLLAS
jgi:hypothetical protein